VLLSAGAATEESVVAESAGAVSVPLVQAAKANKATAANAKEIFFIFLFFLFKCGAKIYWKLQIAKKKIKKNFIVAKNRQYQVNQWLKDT
jgi:hypothetical protein